MNTFQTLKQDHQKLAQLFSEILHTPQNNLRTREVIFEEIRDLLQHHIDTEEELLYPLLKDISASHLQTAESYEEHHLMKIVLQELNTWQKDNDHWLGKMKVLQDLVEHDSSEEEMNLFPLAKRVLTYKQLADIKTHILQYQKNYLQEKNALGPWAKIYYAMTNLD